MPLNKLNTLSLTVLMGSRKTLVSAVALGIAAVILAFLAYRQVASVFATRANVAAEQKKIAQLNQKSQELEQLRSSPEFAQADQINKVLPSHKPLLELLNNLNSVAASTKVAITEFQINPGEIATDSTQAVDVKAANVKKKSNPDYNQLDLKLTIIGELSQVRKFMDLIERVSPITTITNLTVDRKVSGSAVSGTTTRADLSLSTYYYTKSISSTLSAPLPEISAREREVFQAILDFTPADIGNQTGVVTGNNQDLFGINGLNVNDLEQQVQLGAPTP